MRANDPSYCEGQYDFVELLMRLHLARARSLQPHTIQEAVEPRLPLRPVTVRYEGEALDWTNFIVKDEDRWIGGGGFADVYEGCWNKYCFPESERFEHLPRVVVKRFRISQRGDDEKMKSVLREISVWHRLQHENVVRFIGVIHYPGQYPSLVSEYIYNGTIRTYLSTTSGVCLRSLIRGVAVGLQYLHHFTPTIIHGDLKPDNILINRKGQPCLCDFGLSRMLIENTLWNSSASHAAGTVRWQAPELLAASESRVTKAGDIYSYAMCCYEIVTGVLPFHKLKNDYQLIISVAIRKMKLERPADLSVPDDLWELWSRCWSYESDNRPPISQILDVIGTPCCIDGCHEAQCIVHVTTKSESDPTKTEIISEWPKWKELPLATKRNPYPKRYSYKNIGRFAVYREHFNISIRPVQWRGRVRRNASVVIVLTTITYCFITTLQDATMAPDAGFKVQGNHTISAYLLSSMQSETKIKDSHQHSLVAEKNILYGGNAIEADWPKSFSTSEASFTITHSFHTFELVPNEPNEICIKSPDPNGEVGISFCSDQTCSSPQEWNWKPWIALPITQRPSLVEFDVSWRGWSNETGKTMPSLHTTTFHVDVDVSKSAVSRQVLGFITGLVLGMVLVCFFFILIWCRRRHKGTDGGSWGRYFYVGV